MYSSTDSAEIKTNLNTLKIAEWYIKRDFHIIPLSEDGEPLISSWKQYNSEDRRATIEDVHQWLERWHRIKFGAVTGKGSMIIAIHVKEGGNVDRWPLGARSKTSDGGTNLFLWHPGIPNHKSVSVLSAKDILPLTDIYGEDDFVVLPSYDGEEKWIVEPDSFNFAHLSYEDYPLVIDDPNHELTDPPEVLKEIALEQSLQKQTLTKLHDAKPLSAGKLRVWSIGEILTHDFGPEEWTVKSLITKQGITAFSGNPGDYKTWVTIHIALCVSRNSPVFGKFPTTQGGVLIIDEEDHIRVVKGRLELLGAKDSDAIHYLSQSGFKADNDKALQAVVDFVKEKNIKLVILDSLVRIHQQEENDATGMAKVFSSIQKIIAAGASILFTHHHRKQYGFGNSNPGQNMRGSSDILAAVDSHITVERKRDKEDCLLFKQTKSRQGEALKPFEIEILQGPSGPSGFEYAGDYDEKKAKAEEVVGVLPDVLAGGMKSRADIHDGLKEDFGKSAIDDGLKFGEESGLIERVPKDELPKGDRRKVFYRLLGTVQISVGEDLPTFFLPRVMEKQEAELPNCDYELEEVNAEDDREEDCGDKSDLPAS